MDEVIQHNRTILVTGSTGYIGGRLVKLFMDSGQPVRCLVRDPSRIKGRGWDKVTVFEGNVLNYESILPALESVDVAYYFVHSMTAGKGFPERDIQAAENFGRAAKEQGVKRIIYMSGLGSSHDHLSEHLRSRHDTGNKLRESGVPVTEFRAAQVIGSGSLSFEMVRYITERLPIIPSPRWIKTKSQPIAIRNVLNYLVECLDVPESTGQILEIGGPDILGYDEMLLAYARVRGLKRKILRLPFLTTEICAFFIDLITPIPANISRPLIEGLKNEVIVRDDTARQLFKFPLLKYQEAIELALKRHDNDNVETIWSGSISSLGLKDEHVVKLTNIEGMVMEKRTIIVEATSREVFQSIICIGGQNGWLYANPLWWLRAFIDTLAGGVGHRGRRCYLHLRVGDPIDFWRVEELIDKRLLRLHSEMKMPGRGWLQFEINTFSNSKVLITQIAFFEPMGLMGHLYWYALYPVHKFIFSGMIRALANQIKQVKGSLTNQG